MSHKIPSVDRSFHDFQWRMLTLCSEFYDAATKLVEEAPPEVINRCYRLQDPQSVNPLAVLNEAKKTCDFLLKQSANMGNTPSSPAQSPPVAQNPFSFITGLGHPRSSSPRPSFPSNIASTLSRAGTGGLSIFESFRPASATPTASAARKTPSAMPIESSPKRSIRSSTLFPQSQAQINQNQGPWTDQENDRLQKLAEHFKLPNGETDWQKVAAEFGPTRSKHQVLIKATSLGLKPSSTRPSRRPRDPATSSSGTAGAENPRSPSRSASTPGVPTSVSGAPLHQQRTPRTPMTPLEMPMTTSYPSHSVLAPQPASASASAGLTGMMWSTSPGGGNGAYYRQRSGPQSQVPQSQPFYQEPVTEDTQHNPYLWIQPQQHTSQQQPRSPGHGGHTQSPSHTYGF